MQKLPSFWAFLAISLLLSLSGLGGLAYLIFERLPFLFERWLFFVFLTLALSGLALPVTYFLNRRFPSDPPIESGVVTREAIWVGIYGCALAWLQLGRVLNLGVAIVLAAGLILVELLLRMRERSLWAPKEGETESTETAPEETREADE